MIQSFHGYVPSAPQPSPTPAQTESWVKNTNANSHSGAPVFEGWDKRIWSKSYDEIVNFLIERFENTLSELEYYLCILYLTKHIEKEVLHTPFRQSPQYQDIVRMTCNVSRSKNLTITPRKPLNTHRKFTIRR